MMSVSEDKSDQERVKTNEGLTSSEMQGNKTEGLDPECSVNDPSSLNTRSNNSVTASEAPPKEPEFELLNPPDLDESTGDSGSMVKSGASSLGSFAEVSSLCDSPGVEVTMEHSEMRQLLHEAGKESGESSTEVEEHSSPDDDANVPLSDKHNHAVEEETQSVNTVTANEEVCFMPEENESTLTDSQEILDDKSGEDFTSSKENSDVKDNQHAIKTLDSSDFSKIPDDVDATSFSSITYLGSSTVNAPVSEVELKRTMAILKEQSRVAVDVILSIGSTFNADVKLIDPKNKTVIATYQLQKILFCGRGDVDGHENDCFAFNTSHGTADIFHCHVFRCMGEDAVSFTLINYMYTHIEANQGYAH